VRAKAKEWEHQAKQRESASDVPCCHKLSKRRARGSNPQPLTGHFISNEAASHSPTLQTNVVQKHILAIRRGKPIRSLFHGFYARGRQIWPVSPLHRRFSRVFCWDLYYWCSSKLFLVAERVSIAATKALKASATKLLKRWLQWTFAKLHPRLAPTAPPTTDANPPQSPNWVPHV
jgi:hypothetical protein